MKSKFFKVSVFCIIGIVFFLMIQNVLTEKTYMSEVFNSVEALEGDTVDIFFLGTSHMQGGILPMQLYEETGIVSYNLGSSVQQLDETYYLLEYVLQRQSPDLVVLDASNLFNEMDAKSIHRRYIMDVAPTLELKIKLADRYAMCQDSSGIWGALIPMIEYHSRWDELTVTDFEDIETDFDYMAGNKAGAVVKASEISLKEVNAQAEWRASKNTGRSVVIFGNNRTENETGTTLYIPAINEENKEWLLRIKELCQNNNIEMLLTKIPTQISSVEYPGAWTLYRYEVTKAVAEECGIKFWDMTYDSNLKLDFSTDTSDEGAHLNFRGAEKATACMQEYIMANYSIPTSSSILYDKALEQYKAARGLAQLQSEVDFSQYLKKIGEMENIKILMVAYDEWIEGFTTEELELLENLGLQLVDEAKKGDAYGAAIENGTVTFEQLSGRNIGYPYTDEWENEIGLISVGHYNNSNGAVSSININSKKYTVDNKGLNIVIWDNETNTILDSVTFDTHAEEHIGIHNRQFLEWPKVIERTW